MVFYLQIYNTYSFYTKFFNVVFKTAVRFYTESIEFAEKDCVLPLIMARSKAHCKRSDLEAAREDALQLTADAPEDINVIANYADTLFEINQFSDAMVHNINGYQMRKKPDNFDIGQKVVSIEFDNKLALFML